MSSIVLLASRKYPSLPTVGGDVTSHTRVLEALRDAVQTHERRTSDKRASFVRIQDLLDLGAARLIGNNRLEWLGSSSDGGSSGVTALADLSDVDLTGIADGDTLQYDAGSGLWLPVAPSAGGSSGAMVFVGTSTIAGSAATDLTISGLDLDTDKEYRVRVEILSASASQQDVSLYYNADTTATNYDEQLLVGDSTFIGAARANSGSIGSIPAGANVATGDWEIILRRSVDNRVHALWRLGRYTTNTASYEEGSHVWRTASTNVTGITLRIATAAQIAIGSYVKVWKITE